jgi:hypothetical protein
MAHSPLLGGDPAPRVPGGRSTDVLGPSDTSDSGSDVTGAVGAVDTDDLGFDGGTNDDVRRAPGAGADLGDANLDADSDSGGTGERAEAGRDTLRRDAPDISADQVVSIGAGEDALSGLDEAGDLTDMAANEEDEDLIDSDMDDGRSARPPTDSALPRRQRNTDRAVANGEDERGDGRRTQRGGSGSGDPVSERDKSIDA